MIGILGIEVSPETPEEFLFMNFGQTTDAACEALDVYEIGRRCGIPVDENLQEIEETYGIAPCILSLIRNT